ncbi:hypothetical protein ABNZ43_10725 [Weissella sp. GP1]|uniref:hypothetical protein n=1 Tax=Weissella confusa TaxID=1583 RepID=UPI0022E843A7|nr:hypothetical protein [Weissella confusa]
MIKQVLLASVAAMGMFAYATQANQVSATDSPNVVDVLPVNPTERALVLEAKEYGVDYTIDRLDWPSTDIPDDQMWVMFDEEGEGFWFSPNEEPITGVTLVDGKEVPTDPIYVNGNPDATTVDAAKQAVHLYCD